MKTRQRDHGMSTEAGTAKRVTEALVDLASEDEQDRQSDSDLRPDVTESLQKPSTSSEQSDKRRCKSPVKDSSPKRPRTVVTRCESSESEASRDGTEDSDKTEKDDLHSKSGNDEVVLSSGDEDSITCTPDIDVGPNEPEKVNSSYSGNTATPKSKQNIPNASQSLPLPLLVLIPHPNPQSVQRVEPPMQNFSRNYNTLALRKGKDDLWIYQCEDCSYGSDDKLKYISHSQLHAGDRPLTCIYPECGLSFKKEESYTAHMARHGPRGPRWLYKCQWQNCAQRFETNEKLLEHQRTAHRNDIYVGAEDVYKLQVDSFKAHALYRCEECLFGFDDRRSFDMHYKVHEPISGPKTVRGKYVCMHAGCGLRFKSAYNLGWHRAAVHDFEYKNPSSLPAPSKFRNRFGVMHHQVIPSAAEPLIPLIPRATAPPVLVNPPTAPNGSINQACAYKSPPARYACYHDGCPQRFLEKFKRDQHMDNEHGPLK